MKCGMTFCGAYDERKERNCRLHTSEISVSTCGHAKSVRKLSDLLIGSGGVKEALEIINGTEGEGHEVHQL